MSSTNQDWAHISTQLDSVRSKIPSSAVRLVAVSKTKPAAALLEAYRHEQRVFGENYVQELLEKAAEPSLAALEDLEYHFIGRLQSNKVNALVGKVPQLKCVETVDSSKLAGKLASAVKANRPDRPLTVLIQVNSSGEPQKGGVEPDSESLTEVTKTILNHPGELLLGGVMTIGNADYTAGPANFRTLSESRAIVAGVMGVEPAALELSMGMSGDYEIAIKHGATNVRIGSTIFGARDYSK
jgi:pyridoxal phosphate enzyme (YggS family)